MQKSLALQQPGLGLVTEVQEQFLSVAGSGQKIWVLPVQQPSLESLWQKRGRGGNVHLDGQGQQVPEDTVPAACPSCLGTAQGSAWQPWKALLLLLWLVVTGRP